mmetsp:Transcript_13024/g.20471  ORF Transcript_13024/g.20471 Transcript_13024/m.20471 type:complete len:181 (+) Transcript_13024:272-814(+)|eukprot:CAMPEP_0184318920 /NCGR_PEP_ID=MMETSP1049-20130417/105618_1 /TAXON_ID=77928 /ORGANISM="Proteomonas sulcata, Strain CCMP704" /LENGTH=180 /DNA_ID=CAMNT_0026638881 /DNA_START=256 /DNA_END=798 /DNA_ORIENTATION=+
MGYCWFAVSFVYYGLATAVGSAEGSIYRNQAMFAIIEFPVVVAQVLLTQSLGRKACLILSTSWVAYACLAVGLPGWSFGVPSWLFLLSARFFCPMAFQVIYIYAAELFPTSVRSRSMGICSFSARVGSVLAPPVIAVAAGWGSGAIHLVFGFTILGCIFLVLGILPETKDQRMPERLSDL